MKFFFLLLSVILLVVGCIQQSSGFIISGAVLYILNQIINLGVIIKQERLNRNGKLKIEGFSSLTALNNQASILLEIIIFFFAAIVFMYFPNWLSIGCGIIVFGQIIFWILSGLIARSIKTLPIRMGFGGWYVQREKLSRITERPSE